MRRDSARGALLRARSLAASCRQRPGGRVPLMAPMSTEAPSIAIAALLVDMQRDLPGGPNGRRPVDLDGARKALDVVNAILAKRARTGAIPVAVVNEFLRRRASRVFSQPRCRLRLARRPTC